MSARSLAFTVIVCAIVLLCAFVKDEIENDLSIHVLDIGQGDAILVRTPGNKTMLIDGGPGDYVLPELGRVLPPWVRKIDIVVLTHPHADHVVGILEVIRRYSVGKVIWNPTCFSSPEYLSFLDLMRERPNGELHEGLFDGLKLRVDDVRIEYWAIPCVDVEIDTMDSLDALIYDGDRCRGENVNHCSVVVHVSYGDTAFLFTGDLEEEGESEFLSRTFSSDISDVTVLKAGHHCSRTASSDLFLQHVSPQIAICSCGKDNSFGHPHAETLERFRKMGMEYLRTDENGTITILSDGRTWRIKG